MHRLWQVSAWTATSNLRRHSHVTFSASFRTIPVTPTINTRRRPVGTFCRTVQVSTKLNQVQDNSGALLRSTLGAKPPPLVRLLVHKGCKRAATGYVNGVPSSLFCRSTSSQCLHYSTSASQSSPTASSVAPPPLSSSVSPAVNSPTNSVDDSDSVGPSSKVEKTVQAIRREESVSGHAVTPTSVPTGAPLGASATTTISAHKTKTSVVDAAATDVQVGVVPRPLWKRIWDELVHYYHGFRLLFIDIRVCSRLLYRVLKGHDLTRREHKQLVRTTSDLFRLVPFSVFIIVPFMELLLPVALKLFPNMLPSTFQSAKDETAKVKAQLKVKLEMAKFLQTTLDEMAVKKKGETHSHAAKEFAMFCEKIRESGNFASSDEILKFSKLFEDELTLDSLDRAQLVALCRLLDIPTLGTTQLLRFQLRMRLRQLKNDDALIRKEGLNALTVHELQVACRARGMRSLGLPEEKLRYQLNQWLDLSLQESIPPSLLLLSRAMLLPENVNPTEQLREIITHLPKQAITEAKYKIGEIEGKVDNRTKLEIIKQEELAIKEERREQSMAQMKDQAKRVDAQNIPGETLFGDSAVPISEVARAGDELIVDRAGINISTGKSFNVTTDREKCEVQLSKQDLDELEDALETLAAEKKKLLIEKEEIAELKKEVQDYEEDVKELVAVTHGTGELQEAKGAHRLHKKVNAMIQSLDSVIERLNEEKQELKEKETMFDDKQAADAVRDDIIGINDLVLSMRRLQKSTDESRIQMIQEILDTIDSDHDGKIEIDLVLKVIDAVGRENVKVSPKHMKEIIEMMLREEALKKQKDLRTDASVAGSGSGQSTFAAEPSVGSKSSEDNNRHDTRS